jgi:acyl-coenzyme A synthetase/AMP-(fatty) acid ligase
VMERIPAERITVLPGPPTLYQTLLADPRREEYDLSSLRLGVTGAAVVPVELVHAMRDQLGFSTVLSAYIVPAPDVAESDTLAQSVLAWAREAMANYKVPRQVVLVDALPLNAGGKVLKRELRRRHAAGQDHVVPYERSS